MPVITANAAVAQIRHWLYAKPRIVSQPCVLRVLTNAHIDIFPHTLLTRS